MTSQFQPSVVLLSENPIHDTGGGQRSAQLALAFLRQGYRVLFLSRGIVTETVNLGLSYEFDGLTTLQLSELRVHPRRLDAWIGPGSLVISQVPIDGWLPLHRRARKSGATTAYDLIDLWGSELGAGWYSPRAERRLARSCDLLFASAPSLVAHLNALTKQPVHLIPNAFNSGVFDNSRPYERPPDLPGGRIALYVGALWGGWFDWDLVRSMAASLSDTQFVFIGDYRGEGGALPGNCHFLGLKPQVALPAYLANSALAILPWKTNALTHATSPLKVYEFAAMGLPVVAPDIEPLRGIPGVRRAIGTTEFTSLAGAFDRAALDERESAAIRDFAQENSWEQRVTAILALAAQVRETPPARTSMRQRFFTWLWQSW